MPSTHRIATLGLTPFEQAKFAVFCRSTAGRGVALRLHDDLATADAVIVNADDPVAVEAAGRAGKLAVSLMVGDTPRPGAAQVGRPLAMGQAWRALQHLLAPAPPADRPAARPWFMSSLVAPLGDEPTPVGASPAVQRVLGELATLASSAPAAAARPANRAGPAAAAAPAVPAGQPTPRLRLLVLDPEPALPRDLSRHLEVLHAQVVVARGTAEAVQIARDVDPDAVLIATWRDGLDSFHACRALLRDAMACGRTPPRLVLVGRLHNMAEHARARQAGATACLEPPLDADALLRMLTTDRAEHAAFVDTVPASTIPSRS